jgi:hypothetical protein
MVSLDWIMFVPCSRDSRDKDLGNDAGRNMVNGKSAKQRQYAESNRPRHRLVHWNFDLQDGEASEFWRIGGLCSGPFIGVRFMSVTDLYSRL